MYPYLMGVCTSCTQTHSKAGSIFSDPAGQVQSIMWALAGMAGGINSFLSFLEGGFNAYFLKKTG
jgi:hypothetical protein